MNHPLIINNKWNYLEIQHNNTIVKRGDDGDRADVIMWYDNYTKWNWKNKETFVDHHDPGVSKHAVNYLIGKGCDIIIISKGYGNPTCTHDGVLKTHKTIIRYLKKKKITVYHLKSEIASLLWNKLVLENKKVGMLFHSTC